MRTFHVSLLTAAIVSAACAPRTEPIEPEPDIDWSITPAQLTEECDSALATARAGIKETLKLPAGQRTFAKGLRQIEETSGAATNELLPLGMLYLASPDSAIREASLACSKKTADFGVEVNADPEIFSAAEEASRDAAVKSPIDEHLIKLYIENGRRSGAGLDSAKRARVTDLQKRLNDVQRDFSVALASDSATIRISASEVDGLAPEFVQSLKKSGDGYAVRVDASTNVPFLSRQKSSAARQRFYVAYFRRGGPANVKRLEHALALRDTLAPLLGFDTWAAYQLDNRMARSSERVLTFLREIDAALLPKAREEVAALASLMKAETGSDKIQPWDIRYYAEQLRQKKYALDEQAVRDYFPVEHVTQSALKVYEELLGVTFTEVTHGSAWAPNVSQFYVNDTKTEKMVGTFYLDLFPRPNKYQHFAAFPLRVRGVRADGRASTPVCAVLGNWPTSTTSTRSLLSHDEVETFFHEFGHVMHCVLSTAPYVTTMPFNGRFDFIEAPSQIFENWAWEPSVLARISKHKDTGQPLPDSLVKRMIEVRHIEDGRYNTQQVLYGLYDMTIHSQKQRGDLTALWARLANEVTALPMVPGTLPEASFGHLMSGYDVGYYGYLWSKVYAEDMLTRFAGKLLDPAVGRAYRDVVLGPGASQEAEELVRKFLGREVSYDAFYRSIGVKQDTAVVTRR